MDSILYSILYRIRVGTRSRFNVQAIVDGHPFSSTLLPSKNGHYMVYNKTIKSICKKEIGDSVHVVLKPDVEERVLDIPDYILEKIKSNPIANSGFNEFHTTLKEKRSIRLKNPRKKRLK